MKHHCERIRNAVAELGPQGLYGDEAAQEHVAGCEECYAFLEAAAELEVGLDALEPIDAPDAVVARLLERIDAAEAEGRRGAGWRGGVGSRLEALSELAGSWTLRPAVAAGLFVVVMSGLLLLALPERARMPADEIVHVLVPTAPEPPAQPPNEPAPVTERLARSAPPPPPPGRELLKRQATPVPAAKAIGDGRPEDGAFEHGVMGLQDALAAQEARAREEADQLLAEGLYAFRSTDKSGTVGAAEREVGAVGGRTAVGEVSEYLAGSDRDAKGEAGKRKKDGEGAESRLETKRADEDITRGNETDALAIDDEIVVTGEAPQVEATASVASKVVVSPDELARWAARDFLSERERLDGLTFQEASGYWANTYVPGDPLLRLLDARLSQRDRSPFEPFAPSPIALHDASRQAVQPFDPPQDSALGVYLSADRDALEGEGRMLVQVGLEATPRRSGRRGAMNLALVLDLRGPVDVESAAAMRALVFAFAAASDVGDRFHLAVAGRPGGLLIGPDDFRHGPLAVALEQVLDTQVLDAQVLDAQVLDAKVPASPLSTPDRRSHATAAAGATLDLDTATETAIDAVTTADDPAAPLGSSTVILVTAQPLAGTVGRLEQLAHTSAVAGVPVSVVGVGEGVVRPELDRVALAGQGTRRLLTRPADAETLAEGELTAASRVVARAVRLRIRLAPGVRLVDVLGSYRLDGVAADRVREAEQSIDRRLARNLGITADRGEDEEGIQIVIPSFFAGDSHVVLLDVVAPGPGPVVDVTVRFKDLVFLRNGVARAQLAVERGESARGPLQINVLENLLALRLYGRLEKAGLALARGDARTASDELAGMRTLLAGIVLEMRELKRDPGLHRDMAMLDEYLALIDADLDADGRIHLAESLRLAGRLKVLPRPVALGGGR